MILYLFLEHSYNVEILYLLFCCCDCSLVSILCTLQELITRIGQSVKTIKAWKLYGRAQEHLVHLLRLLHSILLLQIIICILFISMYDYVENIGLNSIHLNVWLDCRSLQMHFLSIIALPMGLVLKFWMTWHLFRYMALGKQFQWSLVLGRNSNIFNIH